MKTLQNTPKNSAVGIRNSTDFSPFGVELKGRNFEVAGAGNYRYGFNGMEGDPEVKGEGNSYTTEFRQYDPRLGRWLSIDPVFKPHESPYASNGNNPIWFIDPTGADSSLAAGGTTWQWSTEQGDTYSSISKRTGVSIGDLRYFNQDAIKDDAKIPTGTLLNISDPECNSSGISSISIPEGSISVQFFDEFRTAERSYNGVSMLFSPISEESGAEFKWFQTFGTNDPLPHDESGKTLPSPPDRSLVPIHYESDVDAGMRAYRRGTKRTFPNGNVVIISPNDIGHYDLPNRTQINSGTIKWSGTLSLCKKVDGNYIIIKTFTYSWSQQGMNNVMSPLIYSDEPINDDSHHKQFLNEFNNN